MELRSNGAEGPQVVATRDLYSLGSHRSFLSPSTGEDQDGVTPSSILPRHEEENGVAVDDDT